MAVVQKRPGAKPAEIAKQIDISSNQVYALAGRLQRQGKIRRRSDGGYSLRR